MTSLEVNFLKNFSTDYFSSLLEDVKFMPDKILTVSRRYLPSYFELSGNSGREGDKIYPKRGSANGHKIPVKTHGLLLPLVRRSRGTCGRMAGLAGPSIVRRSPCQGWTSRRCRHMAPAAVYGTTRMCCGTASRRTGAGNGTRTFCKEL